MNDHEHTWVPTCIIDTHLHMRAPASLSTAGSSGIYSAILLGFDDINATVLLESMLGRIQTGRSFLEEGQRRFGDKMTASANLASSTYSSTKSYH